MSFTPIDQRLARFLAQFLIHIPISPNYITLLGLTLALFGSVLIANGGIKVQLLGACIFTAARFLDHFDGELARQSRKESRFGYYFDYITGNLSYTVLFSGTSFGLISSSLGQWAIILGIIGILSSLLTMLLNLWIEVTVKHNSVGYPYILGVELEDGIYLLIPIVWLNFLETFLVIASLGAALYFCWTLNHFFNVKR